MLKLSKALISLPLLACGLAACLAADPPKGWKTFESKSGGFQIAFPTKPEESKQAIKPMGGGEEVEQIQFIVGQQNGAFLASHQPAPKLAASDAKTISNALDSARDALVRKFEGKVLDSKEVKLDAATGKEVVLDCPKLQGLLRTRMFLTNGRLYQIIVMGTKDFVASPEADYFLESFKLKK